ncbi:MAG: transcription antitermination factor NusB [Flavipsychrobacter sp.]|nr:transcription antitermination factor NusB [Flavipsychrobacter sp.]
MISRRNIRVKVMQTLYTLASLEHGAQGNKEAAARILNDKLDHVLDIFTVCVLYTLRIAQYAETDAATRSSKYLPSSDDMNVNTGIATNGFVLKMLGNTSFTEKIKKDKLERFVDADWIKKIYQELAKTETYTQYISTTTHTPVEEKDIIKYIWEQLILTNEGLLSHFTDELPGWEDDSELIAMLMQNFFKGTAKVNFGNLLSGEKKEYAQDLLLAVIEKEAYCVELVTPKLVNWDKERVALIDMLLLRMGICELLFFPTIPTKVTINEYIDVAKQYSTPQSGQFVNGVLDNILKDLVKEDKIRKQDRAGK